MCRLIVIIGMLVLTTSCSMLKKKEEPDQVQAAIQTGQQLSPEERDELLKTAGKNWLYGEGLGATALTVGTIALFPPSAIYFVGNSVLSATGYEPIEITDALPEAGKKKWDEGYSTVVSGPGRVSAAVAGEEFRTKERAQSDLKAFLQPSK